MNSLEELKQELELQKNAIINRGGVVQTTYTHPSPSEITAGINSIDAPNLSLATATDTDVLQGKTYYAGNSKLKTGCFVAPDTTLFKEMYLYYNPESTSTYYFSIESGQTSIRPNLFGSSPHKMIITLNEELENVGAYSFGEGADMTIANFEDAINLKTVGEYGFSCAKNIDLSILPNTLTTMDQYSFSNTGENCDKIVVPSSITSASAYTFYYNKGKAFHDEFVFNNTSLILFPISYIYNRIFDCDLILPSNIINIGANFNFGGGFNNMIFHENVQNLASSCFSALATDPVEYFKLETITFLGTTPPQVSSFAFAPQVSDTFKIYVPDESIDSYKARLSNFKTRVFPMSEKE